MLLEEFRCGHLRTLENSLPRPDQPGKFRCRICRMAYLLEWNRKQRRGAGMSIWGSQEHRQKASESRMEEAVRYTGAHRRAKLALTGRSCVSCGEDNPLKVQSALSRETPEERVQIHVGGRYDGLRFSMDPSDYIPLCVACHTRYDRNLMELANAY